MRYAVWRPGLFQITVALDDEFTHRLVCKFQLVVLRHVHLGVVAQQFPGAQSAPIIEIELADRDIRLQGFGYVDWVWVTVVQPPLLN